MSTFIIPRHLCTFFKKQLNLAVEQFNPRPLSSKIKANAGENNSTLVSRNETTQLQQEKTTPLGNMNETTQQEKNNSTQQQNEQLNSAAGTKQLNCQ
ncbi:hypothetical protein TNCV_1307601 [Trichonephila clavipes]|nr:hypothetical protein TNCV_1307601 [Trichonephila clavipes]